MKYIDLKMTINRPFFTSDDIRLRDLNVYKYQLNSRQKKGYIIQAKRGVYVFSEYKDKISGFELAKLIYNPSYISLESALSQYGLIPEYVPSTTSVSTRTSRQFTNDFGTFYFRHIKPNLFWGYRIIETRVGKYLLAEPEKALLDYLHLNIRKIKTETDIEAIRINYEEFNKIVDKTKFILYSRAYANKKLLKLAKSIIKLAKQNADT